MRIISYLCLAATNYPLVAHFAHAIAFDLPKPPTYLLLAQHRQLLVHSTNAQQVHVFPTSSMTENIRQWIVPTANAQEGAGSIITLEEAIAPTEGEIKVLEDVLTAFYEEQNFVKAEPLLTRVISLWERQPAFEQAELYHMRGDCYMYLRRPVDALKDYDKVATFLETAPEVAELTPREEKQTLFLATARALRSKGVLSSNVNIAKNQQVEAAKNYELAFKYSASEDIEDDENKQIMGYMMNPFATWEYSDAIRGTEDYMKAAIMHQIASDAFTNVGDRARALISDLDAVIDLAAGNNVELANTILTELLADKDVEGRDIRLLQRVIAKKGEAQIAVAAALWDSNDRSTAEAQYGEACLRLEQLDAWDAKQNPSEINRASSSKNNRDVVSLGYSMDDLPSAGEISCAKFKNDKFVSETLRWPTPLKQKLLKLENLEK